MKKLLKNKKGFTLLEVLVTVGIVGVLSAIAIPAYKQYKDNANETAVKLEVSSAHKAYLAKDTVENSFCFNLAGAGVATIGTSAVYKNASKSFAGFETDNCNPGVTGDIGNDNGNAIGAATCALAAGSFKLGAGFEKTNSRAVGYWISDGDSGPTKSTPGSAHCTDTTYTAQLACENNGKVWVTVSITDICA